jgi:hypothetical protein
MASSFDKDASLWGSFAGLGQPPNPTLAGALCPNAPGALGSLFGVQTTRRRVFFSFHYADIMRVNNVRLCGEFAKSSTDTGRNVEGFYDNSLWESRKLDGPDSIKNLIRDGVKNSSAVCVLIGAETWLRRWVKYEIARAIIDGRGLLGVHINSINHHQHRVPHQSGSNPLDFVGVCKQQAAGILSTPKYYLYEKKGVLRGGTYVFEWHPYDDYTQAVDLPPWLADPLPGYVMPLSANTLVYDFIQNIGHKNIGAWIDTAAIKAGR